MSEGIARFLKNCSLHISGSSLVYSLRLSSGGLSIFNVPMSCEQMSIFNVPCLVNRSDDGVHGLSNLNSMQWALI